MQREVHKGQVDVEKKPVVVAGRAKSAVPIGWSRP